MTITHWHDENFQSLIFSLMHHGISDHASLESFMCNQILTDLELRGIRYALNWNSIYFSWRLRNRTLLNFLGSRFLVSVEVYYPQIMVTNTLWLWGVPKCENFHLPPPFHMGITIYGNGETKWLIILIWLSPYGNGEPSIPVSIRWPPYGNGDHELFNPHMETVINHFYMGICQSLFPYRDPRMVTGIHRRPMPWLRLPFSSNACPSSW
jgi:hypothetical protein